MGFVFVLHGVAAMLYMAHMHRKENEPHLQRTPCRDDQRMPYIR